MRLRFGVGERFGPFWAGITLSPKKYFDYRPQSQSLTDSPGFVWGCMIATIFTVVGVTLAVIAFLAFLVLLL